MKKYFILAAAALAMVACSKNEAPEYPKNDLENALSFGAGSYVTTRVEKTGSEAATKLNNQFIVYGIKNEDADDVAAAATGNLVFDNYQVNYVANSAWTSTSNTSNWEYVGYTHSAEYQANIDPALTVAQTIKYWDNNATDYVFYAVSALPADITGGKVKFTKTTSVTSPSTVYDKGYTVAIAAGASLDDLYFADRVKIAQSANTNREAVNTYNGKVSFTFRGLATKLRVAMFETVPGYTVKIDKFYTTNAVAPAFSAMTTASTSNFTANIPNNATGTAGSLTVTYFDDTEASVENHAKVVFAPTAAAANVLTLGDQIIAATQLATTSSAPTYDKAAGAYTSVFPQEANANNLKLKVDFTLTSTDGSGETIKVQGATAEIPAQYLQWKPNFAYTYIFKISDDVTSGGDKVLYPITFDAVVVEAEDGTAEYITTVSEPSITTFAVKDDKYMTSTADYTAPDAVFAVVEESSALVTLSSTNMKVYTVTTTDATNFPITEASVAEALATSPVGTAKIACTAYTTGVTYENAVPAEDGTTLTLHSTDKKALKLATPAADTYAVEYINGTAKTYKVIVVK